ncbi:MAG: acyl-CoA carboxylase subunit beta, partial [Sphingobacteriales bacterium]|nr:acyl-CoA carboxylase subunit beta [Sphingobacteriales bacterium]
MNNLTTQLHDRLAKIYTGGGAKAAAKQKEKGKMLARERVAYLLDADKPQIEIGALAGYEMYEEHGGCAG